VHDLVCVVHIYACIMYFDIKHDDSCVITASGKERIILADALSEIPVPHNMHNARAYIYKIHNVDSTYQPYRMCNQHIP